MSIIMEKLGKESKPDFKFEVKDLPEANSPTTLENITDSILITVHCVVPGTSAATSTNYGIFWTAPFPCTFVKAYERHVDKGTDASAVTLDVVNVDKADGTALASGVSMLASTFDLKGAINTNQVKERNATLPNSQLEMGDSIGLKTTGTLTAVQHVSVTIILSADLRYLRS